MSFFETGIITLVAFCAVVPLVGTLVWLCGAAGEEEIEEEGRGGVA